MMTEFFYFLTCFLHLMVPRIYRFLKGVNLQLYVAIINGTKRKWIKTLCYQQNFLIGVA